MSLLKVEKFELQIFFRQKICVGQSLFTKFSFCEKFSWMEMGLLSFSTKIFPLFLAFAVSRTGFYLLAEQIFSSEAEFILVLLML